MINYHSLGADKRLNQIVLVGSHDAAITDGGGNARTQGLDIYAQATVGVRIFDIRITGAAVGANQGSLKAYHGKDFTSGREKSLVDTRNGVTTHMATKPMLAGTYGIELERILCDADRFVRHNTTEFVILKFDKCNNWFQIAMACIEVLKDNIFAVQGNLNNTTLEQLQGKVVILFSGSGQLAAGGANAAAAGILAFKNLAGGGSYDPTFVGLQYHGKGGTSPFAIHKTATMKMNENIGKQSRLMRKGSDGNPDVIGMMYWTATGLTSSIEDRNDFLWNDANRSKLDDLWKSSLPSHIKPEMASAAPFLKVFMPNIVMIDFADNVKCDRIFALNALTPVQLSADARRRANAALSSPFY